MKCSVYRGRTSRTAMPLGGVWGRGFIALAALAWVAGCDEEPPESDGGSDAGEGDSGTVDSGVGTVDGGFPLAKAWAPQPWEACESGGRHLEAGPDDYRDVLDTLMPGDTLALRPGTYTRGLPLRTSGSEGQCIVVEALDPAARPRFLGSNGFNIIAVHGASWIKVRNLDIDGLGLAGFGVASQGGDGAPTHHVVIEGLNMVGLGGDQQIVGVSTKSVAWDWVIRGNRIVGAGTGMYLGNSDGSSAFIRGVIEFNTVLDTIGYSAQVKHQNPRPALDGVPSTSSQTLIRWNVFSKSNGASTGGSARPNLLLGHLPLSGIGEDDAYLVYGNFFYDNPTENLMQVEGNVAVYNNVFVNPHGGALTVQPHNDVPRQVDVFLNVVVAATGTGITLRGGAPGFSQRVSYNAVYGAPISADDEAGNVVGDLAAAATALVDPTAAPGAGLDLHPVGDALQMTIDSSRFPEVLHRDLDFDELPRMGRTVGAYVGGPTGDGVALALAARTYLP